MDVGLSTDISAQLAIANGCFFNLGARLARYTENDTYAQHAEKTWDWLWKVEYIDHDSWLVYDGGHVEKDCKDINKATFSYNAGVLLQGCAFMYNYVRRLSWALTLTLTRLNYASSANSVK